MNADELAQHNAVRLAQHNEQKALDKLKTAKGRLPALAHDPILNAAQIQAVQAEIVTLEEAYRLARIATLQAQIAELE